MPTVASIDTARPNARPSSGERPPPPAPSRSFVEVLQEGRHRPHDPAAAQPASPAPPPRPAAEALRSLLDRAFSAERHVDAVLEAAAKRRTFSATELLAIQVQVFRYSQTVEVISRATDKLLGGVKQALNTQV